MNKKIFYILIPACIIALMIIVISLPKENIEKYRNESTSHSAFDFPFNSSYLEGWDGSYDIRHAKGIISNQFWIGSSIFNEYELRNIIDNYSNCKIVGYFAPTPYGLLIECDEISLKEGIIELLINVEGVDYVNSRQWMGEARRSIQAI